MKIPFLETTMTCEYPWNQTVANFKARIARSNIVKMTARSNFYPRKEWPYLSQCFDWKDQNCDGDCFCRQHGSSGVWTIKPKVPFNVFVFHYAALWAKGSADFYRMANNPQLDPGDARWAAGIRILRLLRPHWNNWKGTNVSLPATINKYRRCFFCDDAFSIISDLIAQIKAIITIEDATGVYSSKLLSSLFYDTVIPYDTDSGKSQRDCGWKNNSLGRDQVACARAWLTNNNLTIDAFRALDNAKVAHWINPDPNRSTACSRPIDKQFYG